MRPGQKVAVVGLALLAVVAIAGTVALVASAGSDDGGTPGKVALAERAKPPCSTVPRSNPPVGNENTLGETKEPPVADEHALALARTGMLVSANTVGPWLGATFPESFGGIHATKADGSAYAILVVGDRSPIQAAMAERLATPGLVGPLPEVSYRPAQASYARLQAVVGEIANAETFIRDGQGSVAVGADIMRGGLVVSVVGPTNGIADRLRATYGVPIVEVKQLEHPPSFGTGSDGAMSKAATGCSPP